MSFLLPQQLLLQSPLAHAWNSLLCRGMLPSDGGDAGAQATYPHLPRIPQVFVRTSCLLNETAPEKFSNRYENGLKARKIRKRSETCLKNVKPLSRCLNISHRHFSKSFAPPKISTKEHVFFHCEALQGWPRKVFGKGKVCSTIPCVSK